MKRWNRKNELLADAAERASVAAQWLGGGAAIPAKRLYDAWDLVLGSQMHDMLPGTSLPKAYEYCWNDELLAAEPVRGGGPGRGRRGGVRAWTRSAQGVSAGRLQPAVDRPRGRGRGDGDVPRRGARLGAGVRPGRQAGARRRSLARDGKAVKILFLARVPRSGFAAYDARPAEALRRRAEASLKVGSTTRWKTPGSG